MIGFAIHDRGRVVDTTLVEKFRGMPVANISDVMSRMAAGGARLRPWHDGTAMAGPALTVKTRPGDNLMVHKALELARPGDIVVVDAGGDLTNAIIGEIMTTYARTRGLGGIVINGAIRDSAALRRQSMPIYAAGVTHRGPYKDGPGEINGGVALDGMHVQPGDLMVGDEDGVLCIPYAQVPLVYAAAVEKNRAEAQTFAQIAQNRLDTAWIDARLDDQGLAAV